MHRCAGWESQDPAQHVAPGAAEEGDAESWSSAKITQPSADAPLTCTGPQTTESQADASALSFTPAGLLTSKDSRGLSLSVER